MSDRTAKPGNIGGNIFGAYKRAEIRASGRQCCHVANVARNSRRLEKAIKEDISISLNVAANVAAPAQARDLARRVRRLAPSHRDPEAYHIEKSEIAAELMTLARRMEGRSNG